VSEAPKRTPPRLIELLEIRPVTPSLLRLTFGGPALEGFGPGWPAAHIKLFFPRGHQTVPQLPTLNAEGRPVWPPAGEAPVVRTYSVRRHDVSRQTLEVDFVIHEPSGPASHWAAYARPGMKVGLAGPGGPQPMLSPADWYLLTGDLSALPGISALVESMPRDARGHVFVQLDDARDQQELRAPKGVQVHWLVSSAASGRAGQAEADGSSWVETVRRTPFPEGTPQVWLAGENTQVVALRDHLLKTRPASRAAMYAVPYWKRRQNEEQYHKERHRIMDELSPA